MSSRRRSRRVVTLSALVPSGGRPQLWAYGYADLARLLGLSEAALRQRVRRGTFDPGDLAAVVEMAAKIRQP